MLPLVKKDRFMYNKTKMIKAVRPVRTERIFYGEADRMSAQ